MIIPIVILSLLFFGIGFIVSENNADYMLSGYNTMSQEEKQKFDIKSYLTFFRKFHIFLGISLFIISSILYYFTNPNWSGIFMSTYPILAYAYLIWKTNKYSKQDQKRKPLIATGFIFMVFLVICFMFYNSLKDNNIEINNQTISIRGDYGITLKTNDIKSIELVNNIPEIAIKQNGFGLGNVRKGHFKTKSGETVLLFINSEKNPIILITINKNQKIYYSSKEKSDKEIFNQLQNVLKNKTSNNKV